MNNDTLNYIASAKKWARRYHLTAIFLVVLCCVIFVSLIVLYGFIWPMTTSLIPFFIGLILFGISYSLAIKLEFLSIDVASNAKVPLAFIVYQSSIKQKKRRS